MPRGGAPELPRTRHPAERRPRTRAPLAVCLAAALGLASCGPSAAPAPEPPPASAAQAASDPVGPATLERIVRAERELAYRGYKTAYHGADASGRRTRMRIVRRAGGPSIIEWDADGATQRRWIYRSRQRWIDEPALLLENYSVELAAEAPEAASRVAWRPARRIEIRPRRPGRPSMTLLVDAETWLVLGETLHDADGVTRFAWSFDTLEYGPDEPTADAEDAEHVEPALRAGRPTPADAALPRLLTLEAPPEGFRHVGWCVDPAGGVREYWSDGLAAFAVRQRTPPEGATATDTDGRLARRECGGRVSLSGLVGGIDVELQGNLAPDELAAVAQALRVAP